MTEFKFEPEDFKLSRFRSDAPNYETQAANDANAKIAPLLAKLSELERRNAFLEEECLDFKLMIEDAPVMYGHKSSTDGKFYMDEREDRKNLPAYTYKAKLVSIEELKTSEENK